jgi:hypothetical protein
MTKNEYIVGSRENVDRFARAKRWQAEGRASWITPDGVCIHFLAFEEQLAAVSKGERLYVVGRLTATASRKLKKAGAKIIRS